MRRREVVAGLGALGVFGAGAVTVYGGYDPFDSGERIEGVDVTRLDATGSHPGTETVPESGRVTYLSLFATWCGSCQAKMEPLGEVAAAVSDDVQFLSVTNEPIGQTIDEQDVVDWWHEYDGDWPVAHDADLELSRRLDAPGVPYSVVLDEDNRIVWSDGGYKDAETILDRIEAVQ